MWENISTAVKQMLEGGWPHPQVLLRGDRPALHQPRHQVHRLVDQGLAGGHRHDEADREMVHGDVLPFWKNLWEDIVDVWDGVKTAFTRFTLWMQERAVGAKHFGAVLASAGEDGQMGARRETASARSSTRC